MEGKNLDLGWIKAVETDDGRQDVELNWVDVTRKVMSNGEVRTRARFPKSRGSVRISVTEGVVWEGNVSEQWQEAHYHKGQIETYVIVSGWVAFATEETREQPHVEVLDAPGKTMTFYPEHAHNVLLGPGAVIVVSLSGDPVGNPERKMNDWWPAYPAFNKMTKAITMTEIDQLLR